MPVEHHVPQPLDPRLQSQYHYQSAGVHHQSTAPSFSIPPSNNHASLYEQQHHDHISHPLPPPPPPPPTVHPLSYSQENPKAPVGHIVHQQYLQPAYVTVPSDHYTFTAGFVQKDSLADIEGSSSLSKSRRTVKKIGQRREDLELQKHHGYPADQSEFQVIGSATSQHSEDLHGNPRSTLHFGQPSPSLPFEVERAATRPLEPERSVFGIHAHADVVPPLVKPTRSMPISGLISLPDDPTSKSKPVYSSPRGTRVASSARPPPQFRMLIRQQPVNARACGFGERDRRVIDPPPILQMIVNDPNLNCKDNKLKSRYPPSIVHCTLWHADSDEEDVKMQDSGERRQQRRLMGTLVSSPFVGRDEKGEEGCFFTFPDLSCRTSGRYRLRFVLVKLDLENMGPGSRAPFESIVISDVFHVFAAKDFPGMRPSTALTKELKKQGCLISVKKGNDKKGAADVLSSASNSEDEGVSDGGEKVRIIKGKRKPNKKKQKRA